MSGPAPNLFGPVSRDGLGIVAEWWRMTRCEELEATARDCGLVMGTYSPGDGVTRYRFGPAEIVTRRYGYFDEPLPENRNPNSADYFGMSRVFATVLGAGDAQIYLSGAVAAWTVAQGKG